MNIYHCMVALKDPGASFGFSAASEAWFEYLCGEDLIKSWRLMRRKLPLASGAETDFIIEVELEREDMLAHTFPETADASPAAPHYFERLQVMIHQMHIGPYRPYFEYDQRERVRLH